MVMQWGQFLGEIELFSLEIPTWRAHSGLKSIKKVQFREATLYVLFVLR